MDTPAKAYGILLGGIEVRFGEELWPQPGSPPYLSLQPLGHLLAIFICQHSYSNGRGKRKRKALKAAAWPFAHDSEPVRFH